MDKYWLFLDYNVVYEWDEPHSFQHHPAPNEFGSLLVYLANKRGDRIPDVLLRPITWVSMPVL